MRKHRVALIIITLVAVLAAVAPSMADTSATTQETSWTSSVPHLTPQRTMLLNSQSLRPLAVFATAVADNQAAQAFATAEANVRASMEAASYSTPRASGPSVPASTSAPTGACGAEDSIAPAAAARAEAAGVPCAWVPTAVCEEQGNDDPYAGYFGILEWQGYGGYPQAGAAPLDVQLGWESAHGQGPPDAPGQCHSY